MPLVSLQPGYVLHARTYRESSLLLEVFSRDHGRVGLVARGARGARSRWKNLLQPFRPLLLGWTQRGELGTLTHAEQVASPPQAQGESLFCGLYTNEILMRALQRADPHPGLFESYRNLLIELATREEPEYGLRIFERDLLESLGLGLQLQFEHGSGLPIEASSQYRYVAESGPVRLSGNPDDLAPGFRARAVSGAALLALQENRLEPQHLPELKRLMRDLLQYHLGDKPLKTLSLFH